MNKKEREQRIRENLNLYCTPGNSLEKPTKNVVYISTANSLEHEISKLKVCYELKALGSEFLTEAERKNSRPRRRVDIVDLSSVSGPIEIEIEKNHKIKKPGAITIYI